MINNKIEMVLTFLCSFGFGAFFIENHKIIGNFLGALISTVIINLVKSYFDNRKNRKKPKN